MDVLISILYFCFFISITLATPKPIYFFVKEGETAELKINRKENSIVRYVKGEKDKLNEYNYAMTKPGYNFSCGESVCVLNIQKVQKKHADKYKMSERVEGEAFHTPFYLLVGDMDCNLVIRENEIGENDCDDVEADKVTRMCKLSFAGSSDYKPIIKWRMIKQSHYSVVTAINKTQDYGDNKWEVKDKVVVENDDVTFEAVVDKTSIKKLFSPPQGLLHYALNTTASDLTSSMISTNKHSLMCEADVSANVHCSYKWILFHTEDQHQRHTRTEFEGAYMRAEDIEETGRYECHAICYLANKPCTILADSFFFTRSQHSSISIIISIFVVLILIILALCIFFYLFRRRSRISRNKTQNLSDNELLSRSTTSTTTTAPIPTHLIINPSTTTTAPIPTHLIINPSTTTSNSTTTPTTTSNSTTTPTTTSNNTTISTPQPQNKPIFFPLRRSFRRTSSNKSLLMAKIAEEDPPGQKGMKIILNASRGEVKGVCVLEERIYVVCSDSKLLMVYHLQEPHNRLKPEEILITTLIRPTHLTYISSSSSSLLIPDYSDNHTVYRLFPKEKRVCSCRVHGNPASISCVGVERVVVILKRHHQLHLEMYDTNINGDDGKEQNKVDWTRKQTYRMEGNVTLPLATCLSSANVLCLLYASGKHRKNRFEKYMLTQYVLETGRHLDGVFDLSHMHTDVVCTCMHTDEVRGGVCVLQSSPTSALWNIDTHLKQSSLLLSPHSTAVTFCLHDNIILFGTSSSSSFSSSHPFIYLKSIPPFNSPVLTEHTFMHMNTNT